MHYRKSTISFNNFTVFRLSTLKTCSVVHANADSLSLASTTLRSIRKSFASVLASFS